MDENITPQALPGTEQNVPAAGSEGAGSNTDEVVSVKDLVKLATGKEFPTDELAMQSLQDTYKWGLQQSQKVKTLEQQLQDASKTVSPDFEKKLIELETTVKNNNFYQAHPEYNTPALKSLIADMGANPEEVVAKESFKTAAAAITKSLEMDQSQSILHSNPRLGIVQDSMTKAADAQKAGNDEQAAGLATAAVLEAFPGSK